MADKIADVLAKYFKDPIDAECSYCEAAKEVAHIVRAQVAKEMLGDELLEVGRKAVEDVLIEWRNNRLSEFTRGNGLCIREKDGKDSSIIRFGPETALRIGIKAMLKSKHSEVSDDTPPDSA